MNDQALEKLCLIAIAAGIISVGTQITGSVPTGVLEAFASTGTFAFAIRRSRRGNFRRLLKSIKREVESGYADWLARAHGQKPWFVEANIENAVFEFERVIAQCIPTPDEVVSVDLDGYRLAELMLRRAAQISRAYSRNSDNPAAQEIFRTIVAETFKRIRNHPEYAARLRTYIDQAALNRLTDIKTQTGRIEGKLDVMMLQDSKRQSEVPKPFVGVPPRVANFTGRVAALNKLQATLSAGKPAAITQQHVGRAAVQGLGGIGKTTLAIEYAHRFRDLYAGVCWCRGETRTALLTALSALGLELGGIPGLEQDVEELAAAALRQLAGQREEWLLVYDNVAGPEVIVDLLPSAGARVLITSRFSDWGAWTEEVPLDVMMPEEAVDFLQKRADHSDENGAKILAEALGNLPLALDHAASYCRRTQLSFADYAKKAENILAIVPRGASYQHSVSTTFILAIGTAMEQCKAAEHVMDYIAQGAPESVPLALLEGAIDNEQELSDALAALTELSLLHWHPFPDGTPGVSVHRLVHAIARSRATDNGTTDTARIRFTERLTAIYPLGSQLNLGSWRVCAQLTPHLLALYAEREPDSAQAVELVERAGLYFLGRGAYAASEDLFRTVLMTRERILGLEHSDTATALNNLAYVLQLRGNFRAAKPLFERALAIREGTLGREHPVTAIILDNLVHLFLLFQSDVTETARLAERALAITEKALAPNDVGIAMSLHHLAGVRQRQGDFIAARQMYERVLTISEKALSPAHPLVAAVLNNLASLTEDEGDLISARTLHERALAIKEVALGPNHPDTGLSVHSLGRILHLLREFTDASAAFERALQIFQSTLGTEHPTTATCLHNFACLREDQGRRSEAKSLYRKRRAVATT